MRKNNSAIPVCFLVVVSVFLSNAVLSQNYTSRGYVRDSATNTPINNALIQIKNADTYILSDSYGFFELLKSGTEIEETHSGDIFSLTRKGKIILINTIEPAQSIELHSLNGKVCGKFENSGFIDLSNQTDGVYVLSVCILDKTYSQKIIVQDQNLFIEQLRPLNLKSTMNDTLSIYKSGYLPKEYIVREDNVISNIYLVDTLAIKNTIKLLEVTSTFSPLVYNETFSEYSTSVDYLTTSFAFTVTTSDPAAKITVNNNEIESGISTGDLTLVEGINTFEILVTSRTNVVKTYTLNVTKLLPPPVMPNLLSAIIEDEGGQINLTWEDNSDNELGFIISRITGSDSESQFLDTVGENITTFTDTTVKLGETYEYSIIAYNSSGNSVKSFSIIVDNSYYIRYIQKDMVETGVQVILKNVKITAISNKIIWVQDPLENINCGLKLYFALSIPAQSFNIGDIVTISGTTNLYFNEWELIDPIIEITNSGSISPVVISPVIFSDVVQVDQYGNMLVKIENISAVSSVNPNGQWAVSDLSGNEVIIDDLLYTYPDMTNGTVFSSITGILSYYVGGYTINPRSVSDIVAE